MKGGTVALLVGLSLFGTTTARALSVDLRTFALTPASSIAVSADGSAATVTEDVATTIFVLENLAVPFGGPAPAFGVRFDWELLVAAGNEDYFDFYAVDLSGPVFFDGGFEGSYGGTYQNTFALAGPQVSVPLIFDLYPQDVNLGGTQLLGSFLRISNVEISPVAANPIPEPATFLLLGCGGLAFALRRRRPRMTTP